MIQRFIIHINLETSFVAVPIYRSKASISASFVAMKVALFATLAATASALAPSKLDRRSFFKTAAAVAAGAPAAAFATYRGYPTEDIPKFEPKENFATLYPDKKILLEKKSPVDRIDLAPPGFKTYKNTYPGLFGDRGIVTAPEVKPKAPPPAEAAPAPAA